MSDREGRPTPGDERGAVAVITAVTLTLLILMAGFAIDLGLTRVDTAREQSVSDMAAAAGARTLDVLEANWNSQEACEEALQYAIANLDPHSNLTLNATRSCATAFGSETSCDESTVLDPAEYELGRYLIEIRLPVVDGDPLMQDLDHGPEWDGLACERVGVRITADRQHLLAGVAGIFDGGSERGAVGRAYADGTDKAFASLIILHPTTCQALVAQNTGTKIFVGSRTIDAERFPGVITLYPVPSGCSPANKPVIHLGGSGSEIKVDGLTLSYGLENGVPASRIYDNERLLDGRLSPRPVRGPATTRSDIDHVYNCLADYPSGGTAPRWSPARSGYVNPFSDCDGGGPDHVKQMHAAYQTMTPATVPDGWLVFPDDWGAAKQCNDAQLTAAEPLPPYTGPEVVPPPAYGNRIFINCDGSNGPKTFEPNGFTLEGWEVAVLNGGIQMTGGSSALTVTGPSTSGTIVYLQQDGINRNGGPIELESVFVYLDDGRISMGGTSGTLRWSPPLEAVEGNCAQIGGAPNAACFAKLSFWSNSRTGANVISGSNTPVFLQGIFFSPNNEFEVAGSGSDTLPVNCDGPLPDPPPRVNLRDAQLWASTINVAGNGVITLCPSPEFGQPILFPGSGLIR